MGGLGSGRTKTFVKPAQSEALRLNYGAAKARRNFRSILASTERQLKENPDYVPPAHVIDIHKYVIDRVEGKAAQRIDATLESTVTLDPSHYIEALRRARAEGEAFLATPVLLPSQTMSDNHHSATSNTEPMQDAHDAPVSLVQTARDSGMDRGGPVP